MKPLKVIVGLIIFYMYYYQAAWPPIPNAIRILFVIMSLFLTYHILISNRTAKKLPNEIILIIIFYIIIFIPGLFNAPNIGFYMNQYLSGVNYVLLCIVSFYIVKQQGNFNFLYKVILFTALIYTITLYFIGVEIGRDSRLAISENNNPNAAAYLLTTGIILSIYFWNSSWFYKIMSIGYTFIAVPLILQTGSRKAFIALAVFYIFYLGLKYITHIKRIRLMDLVKLLFIIGVLIGLSNLYLASFFDSVMFNRFDTFYINSEETRISMYQDAYNLFLSYPIFGVGYWNFAFFSIWGTYTHSTYAEVLVSTGIVGTLLWFSSYYLLYNKVFRLYRKKELIITVNRNLRFLLAFFVFQLFYGTGTVQMYEPIFYVFIAIASGYTYSLQFSNNLKHF